jgi:hypothetical protein
MRKRKKRREGKKKPQNFKTGKRDMGFHFFLFFPKANIYFDMPIVFFFK